MTFTELSACKYHSDSLINMTRYYNSLSIINVVFPSLLVTIMVHMAAIRLVGNLAKETFLYLFRSTREETRLGETKDRAC